jgi:hypothetical protein
MSRKSDLLILSEQYAKVYEGMKVVEAPASGGDASAANMGPGGVIEVQPDGKYPDMPKKDENAEDLSAQLDPKTGEAEDWKKISYRTITHHAKEFLNYAYELGYSGEAGERDIEYLVKELNGLIDTSPQETADAWRTLLSWQIETGSADM